MPEVDKVESVVSVFDTHTEATNAMAALAEAGFDMKTVSIIGRGYHSEETVVGFYNTGERMATWGRNGLFWGGIWGMLFGSGFFLIPGLGPVLVAGPLVGWILGSLEGAVVGGGLSALAGALSGIGVPDDSIAMYETALKADKFVVVARCGSPQVDLARLILKQNHTEGAAAVTAPYPEPMHGVL